MGFLQKKTDEGFLRKRARLLKNEFFANVGGFWKYILAFGISPFVILLILDEKGTFDSIDENSSSGWRKEFLDIAKKLLSPKNGKKSWRNTISRF